jgi:hypothetical protein
MMNRLTGRSSAAESDLIFLRNGTPLRLAADSSIHAAFRIGPQSVSSLENQNNPVGAW